MANSVAERAPLPDPHEQPTISVPEAAAILGVHPRTVYNMVTMGDCPHIKLGRLIRIPTAQLLEHYGLERKSVSVA
jgi:excisionase family DNA binding protein